MHRTEPSFRRQFSVRSLLVAGAVASLALPLGQQAYGIGGNAIQAAYTPRESVGAAPSVSLVGGSSNAAAVASTSSGGGSGESSSSGGGGGSSKHVSSADEGNGTTTKHRPRKSSEGGGKVAKGGTQTEAKDYSKEEKPVPLIAPAPKPLIALSTGFESLYLYHGIDIVGFNSGGLQPVTITNHNTGATATLTPREIILAGDQLGQPHDNLTSPVIYINGNIEFKGFHLGVGFIHAIDETLPSREAIYNTAVTINRALFQSGFPVPAQAYNKDRKYYKEVDINTDYTLSIIANVLDATVGYNSYIIPDHDFKGTNYQGEAFGRLAYKQIPYVTPSVTYFRYISDARGTRVGTQGLQAYINGQAPGFEFKPVKTGEYLNGNYVEARIDGAIPLFNSPGFSVAFTPYALISVNDGYLTKQVSNTTSTELNTFETGFKVPLAVGGHFAITPYFNYGYDISEDHEANDFRGHISPFKEDVWAGVTFSYRF